MKKLTKIEYVKRLLNRGRSITSIQAFNSPYQITRLSAIIFVLRGQGMLIDTIPQKTKDGAVYAKYRLTKKGK